MFRPVFCSVLRIELVISLQSYGGWVCRGSRVEEVLTDHTTSRKWGCALRNHPGGIFAFKYTFPSCILPRAHCFGPSWKAPQIHPHDPTLSHSPKHSPHLKRCPTPNDLSKCWIYDPSLRTCINKHQICLAWHTCRTFRTARDEESNSHSCRHENEITVKIGRAHV